MFFRRLVRSIEFATVHWLTSRFVIESWKRGLWSAKIQDSTTVSNTGTYFNRYLLRLSNLLHRSSSLGNQPSRHPFYSKGSCVTFLHNRNGSKYGWRSARERSLVSHLLALNIRFRVEEGWWRGVAHSFSRLIFQSSLEKAVSAIFSLTTSVCDGTDWTFVRYLICWTLILARYSLAGNINKVVLLLRRDGWSVDLDH